MLVEIMTWMKYPYTAFQMSKNSIKKENSIEVLYPRHKSSVPLMQFHSVHEKCTTTKCACSTVESPKAWQQHLMVLNISLCCSWLPRLPCNGMHFEHVQSQCHGTVALHCWEQSYGSSAI